VTTYAFVAVVVAALISSNSRSPGSMMNPGLLWMMQRSQRMPDVDIR